MEDQDKNEDSDALKRIIGARVRELRGTSISQEELAKELRLRGIKIEQAQIGHIEAGRRLPSVQVLIGLADYYATSVDYVVGRTNNPSSLADIEEDLQTGGISGRLGGIYKRLPKDRQEEVYDFAQALEVLTRNEDAPDAEMGRFVRAMLDSFEKRIGVKGVESALDELAREFPGLALGFGVGGTKSPKKKSG